ncbi:cytochrome P450 [Daedalea quercina L-15889]|uniref:Cytochrome P450 n=1 Tax=Daedalea quercina L-15889 TaxID=1314783 RepID=A0A165LS84_9APHY|nr:cytochrome P450 [Daedalea quercina L-15889]
MLNIIAISVVIGVGWALYHRFSRNPKSLPLPPGPKPYPIIGNLFDVPKEEAWKGFAQWSDKYGDIIYFHVLGQEAVVLNSVTAAHDLLDKRSSIYSYRPFMTMANEVIGWNWSLPSMDYGEKFKRHRRYLQQYFSKQNLPRFYEVETQEVHKLLRETLTRSDDMIDHVKRLAAGVTMLTSYGHEVDSVDDPWVRVAEKGVLTIEAAGAVGAHIIDFIPWLRHIPDWAPGGSIKRLPPGTREDLYNFVHKPFEHVKEQFAKGKAVKCYVTDLLEETNGQDEEGVCCTAAVTYSAGFDATFSALLTAVIALVANPIIQARLQAEMDLVIGKDRLPTFADRDSMPYMQAIVSETFRWGATTPVGVPHRLSQDDYYNGYYLPAGCTIMANAWAMLHDPRVYPEPEIFNPDRFLTGEGRTPQPDPRGPAFGFGRRVCPGKDFSENHVWITISSLFYAFKISPAIDKNGEEIPIDLSFFEHSIRHPRPFKYTLKPRRPNSVNLINQTAY